MILQIYSVYGAAGRVLHAPAELQPTQYYTPQHHMVLLVQPHPQSNTTYVVDTSFGGGGPLRPILLSDRPEDIVFGALPGERHRVLRGAYPESSLGTRIPAILQFGPLPTSEYACTY